MNYNGKFFQEKALMEVQTLVACGIFFFRQKLCIEKNILLVRDPIAICKKNLNPILWTNYCPWYILYSVTSIIMHV